ncbi:hypothetical protein DOTSEDRAFT_90854 [Dothistroma septosporum NZE10]|uniref:Zinc-binding loop region of homing endonuclease domain-containing protein n=1 Tax=Dothistroma septosporum (strain NZE10 / CBS 128990) TaxID=675120 RepID=N1PHF4_DOTSN|nr:hypothetical protein DOTSEDRAFT_90854 [Dothistroma septosporum NZE10]
MVKIHASDARGMSTLATRFSRPRVPIASNTTAQQAIVLSDDDGEQQASKRSKLERPSKDRPTHSESDDDQPPTKKRNTKRRSASTAPPALASPAEPAPAVVTTVTTIVETTRVVVRLRSSVVTTSNTVVGPLEDVQPKADDDTLPPDHPEDWSDEQSDAHDTVVAAFNKYMPKFSEPYSWLKCMPERKGNEMNRISRPRPPGAEFAAWYQGECKEAMLALPISLQKAAAFAWEFVTASCGYKAPPWEVGKAPTEELVELLRQTPCIPAYYRNDNKQKTFQGPLALRDSTDTNPQYDAGLWPKSPVCTACNRCHKNTNVRMSALLLLGIGYATPVEIGKHTANNDELSHLCGVAGCIIHARWESSVKNKERDHGCLKAFKTGDCPHGETTKGGLCMPEYHKAFRHKQGFLARVQTLRKQLKALYDQKNVVCA